MELGAEVNIRCRSPQVGVEVIPCRSYSCRISNAPQDGRFGLYWRFINPMIENAHEMFVIVSHIHELEEIFRHSINKSGIGPGGLWRRPWYVRALIRLMYPQ